MTPHEHIYDPHFAKYNHNLICNAHVYDHNFRMLIGATCATIYLQNDKDCYLCVQTIHIFGNFIEHSKQE